MKKLCRRFAGGPLLLGAGLLASPCAQAQVFDPTAPAVVRPDTTEARNAVVTPAAKKNKAAADSAKRTEHLFRAFGYPGIRLTRPGKAALLAAILPGAGQIYNGRWWKLPLVYAGLGGTVFGEYFYQKRYREFADATNFLKEPRNAKLLPVNLDPDKFPQARLQRSVDALDNGVIYYRGYRDIFYLYIGIAYGLQIVDALVDAHLKNFDVSEDLTLHWEPALLPVPGQAAPLPTAPGVLLALRLK